MSVEGPVLGMGGCHCVSPLHCRDVDEPRACHIEWSKSEREKQILWISTHIYVESGKTVLMSCFQGRNRDAEGRGGWDEWREYWHIFTTMCFPGGSGGKASTCNAGNLGSIPGLERSPGEGNGNPLSILVWKIPTTEEPGGLYSPWGRKESDTTERLTHTRVK